MQKKHKLIFLVTLVLSCGSAYSQQQPSQPTAREILDRVVSTYSSCRSYSDEGEMTAMNTRSSHGRHSRFSTAFVRETGFRFHLRPEMPQAESVVWKDANGEKLWVIRPGELELPLEDGLSRVAFMSGGSSLTVPPLLLTNVFAGRNLVDVLTEPKLTGVEKIDGRQAFIIEGKLRDFPARFWIDQSSFLVLKSYRKVKLGNLEEEVTTKYKPAINVEITADKLVFKPPPGKAASQPAGPIAIPAAGAPLPPVSTDAPRLKRFGESLRMNAAQIEALRKKRVSSKDEDVIRVDTDLVISEVAVVDSKGTPVSGLEAKDFLVKEDGKLQEIGSFSLGDASVVPRSIVLILDYSGSELPYIKTSVDAAKLLVDKLNPRDRMALVTDDVKLLVDFTSDKEVLKTNLELLRTRALAGQLGRSAQYDALLSTLRELFTEEDLRPIVIFQTDGDQLGALKGQISNNPDPYSLQRNYGLEDLKTAAEKARATIYSIIPALRFIGLSDEDQVKQAELDWNSRQKSMAALTGRSSSPPKPTADLFRNMALQWRGRQVALTDVASSTGGWASYLEQPEQANEVYARVLSDINTRYVIGYYPANKTRDGKRRTIAVEVRDHPEYMITGRKAYYAPQEP